MMYISIWKKKMVSSHFFICHKLLYFSYVYLGDYMDFKIGDFVTRNSYDNDIVFEIIDINDKEAILKGVSMRLIANSPFDDLVLSIEEREDEFLELLNYADHIVFNSPAQLKKFGGQAKQAGKSVGIRINPEHSTGGEHEIYDPCAKGSRLGTTKEQWEKYMTPELIALLDGIHFHTLCEQDSDALEETLTAVEEKFGTYLKQMK